MGHFLWCTLYDMHYVEELWIFADDNTLWMLERCHWVPTHHWPYWNNNSRSQSCPRFKATSKALGGSVSWGTDSRFFASSVSRQEQKTVSASASASTAAKSVFSIWKQQQGRGVHKCEQQQQQKGRSKYSVQVLISITKSYHLEEEKTQELLLQLKTITLGHFHTALVSPSCSQLFLPK